MLHELVHAALLCRLHQLQPKVLMHYLLHGIWQCYSDVLVKCEVPYAFNLLMSELSDL